MKLVPDILEMSIRALLPDSQARPERAAMERAALARVAQLLAEAIVQAPTRVLERGLRERTDMREAADLLTHILLGLETRDPWAGALLRGAQMKRTLLDEAGGGLSASEAGELLGIGRAAVDKRRRQGTLLGVPNASGDYLYPAAQFTADGVAPGLGEVIAAFRVGDPWMQLDILLAQDEALGNRNAFEALKAGEADRVKTVVASVGEQGL